MSKFRNITYLLLALLAVIGTITLGNTSAQKGLTFTEIQRPDNPLRRPLLAAGIKDGTITFFSEATIDFVDIDGDGDYDAFGSGSFSGTDTFGLNFYENVGTAKKPKFIQRIGSDNPWTTPMSYRPKPVFVDIDNDGDYDAFVGGEEYSDGKLTGGVHYFENVGAAKKPSFKLRNKDNMVIGVDKAKNRWSDSYPAFTDLDGDGDQDLVIGHYTSFRTPALEYYINNNPPNSFSVENMTWVDRKDPNHIFQKDNTFSDTIADSSAAPEFADIDQDGDEDLIIGGYQGLFYYYKNNGDGTFTQVTGQSNPFLNFDVKPGVEGEGPNNIQQGHSAPRFVDIDNDGDLDMFSGDIQGYYNFFEAKVTQVLGVSVLEFEQKIRMDNPFAGTAFVPVRTSAFSSPALTFVDIDNDGDMDAFHTDRTAEPPHFYKNIGNNKNPIFTYIEPSHKDYPLPDSTQSGVNEVRSDVMAFADFDADGDQDFVSGTGLRNWMNYYENKDGKYVEALSSDNPFYQKYGGIFPTVLDFDKDGDYDVLAGNYNSGQGATVFLFENIGTPSKPRFEVVGDEKNNPFGMINIVSKLTRMAVADLDFDGDEDIVLGSDSGELVYYLNQGSTDPQKPNFIKVPVQVSPFKGIESFGPKGHPAFVDIDGDNDKDLFLTDEYGYILFYRNESDAPKPTATTKPTVAPTIQPSVTVTSTTKPTVAPTVQPSVTVTSTTKPTVAPTVQPSVTITSTTTKPTTQPTITTTAEPTGDSKTFLPIVVK